MFAEIQVRNSDFPSETNSLSFPRCSFPAPAARAETDRKSGDKKLAPVGNQPIRGASTDAFANRTALNDWPSGGNVQIARKEASNATVAVRLRLLLSLCLCAVNFDGHPTSQ